MIPYSCDRMCGPYTRASDGRKYMKRYNGTFGENGTTVSYPKYLMEIKLGRYLLPNETVDHKDRDFTNDSIDNLRVINNVQHGKEDSLLRKEATFICQICSKSFTVSGKKLHDLNANHWRMRCGPFCSRSCAGKASHRSDLIALPIPREYEMFNKQI